MFKDKYCKSNRNMPFRIFFNIQHCFMLLTVSTSLWANKKCSQLKQFIDAYLQIIGESFSNHFQSAPQLYA